MKRPLPLAATALILILISPAYSLPGGGTPQGSLTNSGPPVGTPKRHPTADPEGTAEDLIKSGRCDEAIPILRQMSGRSGFEISEFHLGQCLLTLADSEHDPVHAADERKEGATWILRAANSGFAEAEARAVALYLDGEGVDKNPVEAEKWALLYRHNGMRMAIGLPDLTADISNRLDAALNESARVQAQSRADSWVPTSTQTDN